MESNKLKLALVSCGLGHVQRGFEVSASRWHDALKEQNDLDVRLFCGGDNPGGVKISNIPRDSRTASLFRNLGVIQDGCRLEQLSFGLALIKHLIRWKPDVIWLQEFTLADLLYKIRPRLKLDYKILFCNGAPIGPDLYQKFEFIQHLHKDSFDDGIAYGLDPNVMCVLPHCSPVPPLPKDANDSRPNYDLQQEDWVVTCVAALNRHHKRIDYLINEVADLEDPHLRLVLCGQSEADTPFLKALAKEKLGEKVRWMTLSSNQVYELMSLSDVFVLPSLTEGLGAVLIEAALCGVPVVCHPHAGGRAVVADGWPMPDLSQTGSLTARLREIKQTPPDRRQIERVRRRTVEHFGSPALAPQFVEMVNRVVKGGGAVPSVNENEASAVTT